MIVINVQLANISIVSLASGTLTIAPLCLSFILAAGCYGPVRSLQIPAYFVGASSILQVAAQYAGVFHPYNLLQLAFSTLTTVVLACAGIYFLVMTFRATLEVGAHWSLETALLVTWLMAVLMAFALNFFSLGALWASWHGSDSSSNAESDVEALFEKRPPQAFEALHSPQNSVEPITDLGIPFTSSNIPFHSVNLNPPSPQFSFTSSGISLRSGFDLNAGAPGPAAPNPDGAVDMPVATNIHGNASRLSTVADDQNTETVTLARKASSLFKVPKSPKKVALSKSSFSLRRSPSKDRRKPASLQSSSTVDIIHSPHQPAGSADWNSHTVPAGNGNLRAIEIPDEIQGPGNSKWIIIRDESISESRSVSGSSQVTGRIFPAAEYNRKINSAGFQRNEPIPVQVQLSPTRKPSQYELERTNRAFKLQ